MPHAHVAHTLGSQLFQFLDNCFSSRALLRGMMYALLYQIADLSRALLRNPGQHHKVKFDISFAFLWIQHFSVGGSHLPNLSIFEIHIQGSSASA